MCLYGTALEKIMKNKYELKSLITLAIDILQNETEYIFYRKVIDRIFEETRKNFSIESVNIRLTIIDSLYSTNMGRRLFGITDLSNEIFLIGKDEYLLTEIEKYKKDSEDSKISILLKNEYGIRKYGKKVGAARSLISKYLYFVSGHNFPIEDSLVKLNINDVLKYFYEKAIIINDNLLHELISFCENEKIKFDEFDNFMWLLGKLLRGSLSLLLPKDNYLNIIKNLKISSTKSKEVDKEIARKIIDTQYLDLINKDISNALYKFLTFIKDFKNIT
jgi:hypothetical protein